MAFNAKTKNDILKTDSKIVLKANNLSIGYQTKKEKSFIAKDLEFSIKKGELIAIVGRNGIGKSTLLRTLAKIQPVLSGSISINEKPLENYNSLELAKEMSVVLTEAIASKNMTVYEIIALGRQPYTNWVGTLSDDDLMKIDEVIEMVSLKNIAEKKCFELSDGQLQRVMIARALAQDTEIILLDEPTTHLDLHFKISIFKLLRKIVDQYGKTIVFTSHEVEYAIQLCDKMVLLSPEKFFFASPNELVSLNAFNHLFSSDLVSFNSKTYTFNIKA